jgi:hypothetical protein
MSGICKGTPEINSAAQRDQLYPDSILPAAGAVRVDGKLTDSALNSIYEQLENSDRLVTLAMYKASLKSVADGKRLYTKQILESLGAKEKQTMDAIQAEFCFYYARYKYSLDDLFSYLVRTSSGSTLTADQRSQIQNKLNACRNLNTRLNDLVQITNFIALTRAKEMRQQNDEINMLNDKITKVFGTLSEHSKILKQEDAAGILHKRMVEFTQEKNLSANNLLSLYGFLNLVALGLLVYISRT